MILIVEDEEVARRALTTLLRASGYETAAAESAEEAIAMVHERGAPEVVLVDFNLPGMDGMQFIRAMKAEDPSMPAVLMTASDSAVVQLATMTTTKCVYVRKPVDFGRLLSVIRGEGLGGRAVLTIAERGEIEAENGGSGAGGWVN